MPFSALPHYDLRCADVAMTAATRWDASVESYLQGSPEIVVEILSPSNRQREISEKIALCLSTGTQQFCVVDRDDRSVRVTGPDGKTLLYSGDDEIPFPLLEASLEVSEIWAD